MSDEDLTLIEAVRIRPAMYIGSTSVRGFNNLLRAITRYAFRNLAAEEFVFRILGGLRGEIVIGHLGRPFVEGVVCDSAKEGPGDTLGFFELAALNALSESFRLSVKRDGEPDQVVSFLRGTLDSGEISGRLYPASEVRIEFELDSSIFEFQSNFNPYFYLDFLNTLAILNKGRSIVYGFLAEDVSSEITFKFEEGLYDRLEIEKLGYISGGYYFPTHIELRSEKFEAEIAFSVWENSINRPYQVSFVNDELSPENGVHLWAIFEGVREQL